MSSLLIGEPSVTTIANSTSQGKIEAFQYTASESGSIRELQIHSSSVANTGMTSLILGVYTDSSGTPGTVLGEGTFTGVPATNSWISVTGVNIPIIKGAIYWLAILPIGNIFHYFSKVASGGTAEKESTTASHTKLETVTWGAVANDGPASFQGLGDILSFVISPPSRPPTFFSPKRLYKNFPIATEEKKKQEEKLLTMLI